MLLNLLGNAIKFTAAGEVSVTLAVDGEDADGLDVRVEVVDSGIGIERNVLPALFQKFTQADASVTRHFGGTGLGLSICKRLVELMRGRIGVESEPGRGSRFWFTARLGRVAAMPKAPAPAVLSVVERAEPAPVARREMSLLVAEDNPVNRMIAATLLERAGYGVDTAENGAQAVAAVERQRYDLVLMDVQMPVMDGVEATRRIRAMEPARAGTPIVALTADAMAGDRQKYIALGMDDYVSKPFRPDQLLATVEQLIGGSDRRDRPDQEPAAMLDRPPGRRRPVGAMVGEG